MCLTLISRKWLNSCYSEAGLTLDFGNTSKQNRAFRGWKPQSLHTSMKKQQLKPTGVHACFHNSISHWFWLFYLFFLILCMGVTWPAQSSSWLLRVHHTCLRCSDVFSVSVPGGQQWQHFIVQPASVARGQTLSGACHALRHCFTSYLSETHYTPAQQKTFIEMFCQSFNTATVKHGSQSMLIPSKE